MDKMKFMVRVATKIEGNITKYFDTGEILEAISAEDAMQILSARNENTNETVSVVRELTADEEKKINEVENV